jgi:hypothetical protein
MLVKLVLSLSFIQSFSWSQGLFRAHELTFLCDAVLAKEGAENSSGSPRLAL